MWGDEFCDEGAVLDGFVCRAPPRVAPIRPPTPIEGCPAVPGVRAPERAPPNTRLLLYPIIISFLLVLSQGALQAAFDYKCFYFNQFNAAKFDEASAACRTTYSGSLVTLERRYARRNAEAFSSTGIGMQLPLFHSQIGERGAHDVPRAATSYGALVDRLTQVRRRQCTRQLQVDRPQHVGQLQQLRLLDW